MSEKFSDFIRAPGTAGPPTREGISALGFALSSEVPGLLPGFVRADIAQSFTGGQKTQARANIGTVIGTDVQAFSASLASIAGLTTAANQLAYTTAPDTWAVTSLTAFGRTLIGGTDAAAVKTSLALNNVDNTSDANKPISTATQTALNAKASLTGVETLTNKTLTAPVINSPSGEFLRGYLSGLTFANNATDPTNDIDIAAGSAGSDGVTPVLMTLASLMTKRMDAAWAVGSGNGGWLDGASMPNGTGHMFLIRRSDTGVVDVGASASLSPTLPLNYDQKRRIFSFVREGGAIVAIQQNGPLFMRTRATVRSSTAALASSLIAMPIPLGLALRPVLVNDLRITGALADIAIRMGSAAVGSADRIIQILTNNATASTQENLVPADVFTTDTSAQIYYSVTISAGSINLNNLFCDGWIDNRGM